MQWFAGRKSKTVQILVVAGLCAGAMIVEDAITVMTYERTDAKILSITPMNARCGAVRSRYDCTKFQAAIEFQTKKGETRNAEVFLEESYGYGRSIASSGASIGGNTRIYYSPEDPSKVEQVDTREFWIAAGALIGLGYFWRARAKSPSRVKV